RRSRINIELDMKRFLHPGYHGPRWTPEQLALLGTVPAAEVARRTSRTVNAVMCEGRDLFQHRRARRCGTAAGAVNRGRARRLGPPAANTLQNEPKPASTAAVYRGRAPLNRSVKVKPPPGARTPGSRRK